MKINGPIILSSQTISIGAGETGYSTGVGLVDLADFALFYQVACTGTPSVKLELQQSTNDSDWFSPDLMPVIKASVADKDPHGTQIFPISVQYIRIKATELTTTVDDTVVTIKISVQRRYPG